MYYIISEEELMEFFNPYLDLKRSRGELEYKVKDFLKSKKPVELVAEGKILDTENTKNTLKFIFESGNYNFDNFPYGNNIKIYIQKTAEHQQEIDEIGTKLYKD